MSDGPLGCTGASARWCPVHGDCTCPSREDGERDLDDAGCPLHSFFSSHGADPELQRRAEEALQATPPTPPKPRAKRRGRPEMKFLRAFLVEACRIPGVRLFRTFSGKVKVRHDDGSDSWVEGMPPGTADLMGIGRGGCFTVVEVKSKRGRLTKAQEAFLSMVLARDGVAMVARQEFTDLRKSVAHARRTLEALIDAWNQRRRVEAPK